MIDIQEIEQAFVGELRGVVQDVAEETKKSGITPISVNASPESPEEFQNLPGQVGPNGGIIVGYQDSIFGDFLEQGSNAQEQTVRIAVYFLFRNLRDHAGIYDYLRRSRLALNGFEIREEESIPVRCSEERFLARSETFHIWVQIYEIKFLNEE